MAFSEIGHLQGMSKQFNVAAALCNTPDRGLIIIVDQDEFDNCSVRSRFSVAHELGHAIMHPQIYEQARKFSVDEAVKIQKKIEDNYRGLEQEANYFAGAILMPHNHITSCVKELYRRLVKVDGCDFLSLNQHIAAKLAYIFEVSSHAAGIRLSDTGLDGYIRRAAKNSFDELELF